MGDFGVYANFDVSVGLDIMLRGPNAKCYNNPAGLKGWYCEGALYIDAYAGVGIEFKGKEFELASVSIHTGIAGRLPHPTYLEGNVNCNYRILAGSIKGDFDLNFNYGDNCPVVYN